MLASLQLASPLAIALIVLFAMLPINVWVIIRRHGGRPILLTSMMFAVSVLFETLFVYFYNYQFLNRDRSYPPSFTGAPTSVGPTLLTVLELAIPIVLFVWLPLLLFPIASVARKYLQRRDAPPSTKRYAVDRRSIIILGACWLFSLIMTTFVLFITEAAHEDSAFANDFTLYRWLQVDTGMTYEQVHAILGPPLSQLASDSFFTSQVNPMAKRLSNSNEVEVQLWARSSSAGWFAVIWFSDGKVVVKKLWFID